MRRILIGLLSTVLALAAPSISRGQQVTTTPSVPFGTSRVLGKLASASFNTTTDQAIPIGAAKWALQQIWITNCSISLTTAVGGFYSATSKGGSVLVLATQVYSAATSSSVLVSPALNITNAARTEQVIWLSLTTAQGSAATCDVYVLGTDLY